LYNGRDFEGWRNPGNWRIDGEALFRAADGGGLTCFAKRIPEDFELRFEWRVAKGTNSGVLYRPGQYEYQILDNAGHPEGRNPRTSAGALYFCMAPSKDVTKPAGDWNTARIVCRGTVIQHWLNGRKIVDFDYTDEEWAFNVRLLKLRGGDLGTRGTMLHLQDHGGPVWYRSIRLRTLTPSDEISHTGVTPAEVPPDVRKEEIQTLERVRNRRQMSKPQL
jgi:hypothetical protein